MEVTTYGTWGGIPLWMPNRLKYGGDTTCVRVHSPCIPKDVWVVIDGGSAFVHLALDALKAGAKELWVLLTHYHHDHQQGLLMAPTTFIDGIKIRLFGPKEGKWDPHVMMHSVMERGLFPVDFTEQKHHFPKPKSFEHPKLHVMIIHPKGGMKHMLVSDYKSLRAKGEPFPFGQKNERYPLKECMVITMHKSNHPESTICYRMDELPTGKSFALLTDHENQAGIPISLQRHLRDLDLLIEDVQYSLHDYYQGGKAGFGHAAPDYAVKLANLIGAKRLGFTHHDPFKDDDYVEAVLAEGKQCAADALAAAGKGASGLILPDSIFACADFAARPEVIKV